MLVAAARLGNGTDRDVLDDMSFLRLVLPAGDAQMP